MARRVVDVSLLQGLVQEAQGQEVVKGNRKSTDSKFPVFTTPINEDVIVYIPNINVVTDENGATMQVLNSHLHDYQNGKSYGQLRCISGLSGAGFDALGYDGTCPACEATADCWELYREKLNAEAAKIGVDPQNDPTDLLKPIRDKILKEMDLKGAEEYITFPVVLIPSKGKGLPTDDAIDNIKPVFVTWRKNRYTDNIITALEQLMDGPTHPAGLFWLWKFSYDTKGKQATARDSAKNAKYNVIENDKVLKILEGLKAKCEEVAKDFTLVKAAEVIVANQFMYKEDLEVEVTKIMTKTRQLLSVAKMGGVQPIGGQAQIAGGNPLANFGTTETKEETQNLGVTSPIKFTE